MTILLTLTFSGADSGPFDLYQDSDGYTTPFATNVAKSALELGIEYDVDNLTTTVKVISEGVCLNFVNVTLIPIPIINTCDIILQTRYSLYNYNTAPRKLESLYTPGYIFGNDIATTADFLWIGLPPQYYYIGQVLHYYTIIKEYSITYSPWSIVFVRDIRVEFYLGSGLCAIDNTHLILVNESTWVDETPGIVTIANISGIVPTYTNKFSIPFNGTKKWRVAGDYILSTGAVPKLIIILKGRYIADKVLRQYNFNTGVIEIEVDITSSTINPYGIASQNGKLYIFGANTTYSNVYEVGLDYPYTVTQTDVLTDLYINGSSQQVACIDIEMRTTTTTTTI